MRPCRKKRHRLERDRYVGARIIVFATRLLDQNELFRQARRSDECAAILIEESEKRACNLLLACFMPDHVHALLQGRVEESDPLEAFYRFKLRTGVYLDRFCRPAHWQKDFYDHIVRCDGDWRGQAVYNALNPVRAGLVKDAFDYPSMYSSLDARQEILAQIFWEA